MTDVPLHPSLQQQAAAYRRLLRLSSLPIFLITAGVLMFEMVTVLSSRDPAGLLLLALIGLVTLPMMALLGGLLWFLDERRMRRLHRLSRMLRENRPLTARLSPVESGGGRGDWVRVHLAAGGPVAEEPLYARLDPSLYRRRSPRRDISVALYCQGLMPGCELAAIRADGGALLGGIADLDAYRRKRRLVLTATVALLALTAMALGVHAVSR